MCNMQYKLVVYSVQCSVFSIKCTGAGAGAGTVCIAQCAVCSVLPATGEDLAVKTG